jgi:hypothetical protein
MGTRLSLCGAVQRFRLLRRQKRFAADAAADASRVKSGELVATKLTSISAHSPLFFQLGAVFVIALTVFLLLRTSDYLAVDGALRALDVYYRGKPFLHENNHLLYPVNVYLWSALLRSLGLHPAGPLAFLPLAQAMNAVAAAASLTIFYGLVYTLTTRAEIASLMTVGLGLSRAFLAHATNSAEPMVGLLWSEGSVALSLYGLSRKKSWAFMAAGTLLALAMLTYQSMVLLGVLAIFLIGLFPNRQNTRPQFRARLLALFMVAFGASILFGYGIAYYMSGTDTAAGMVRRFLNVPGSHIYGGLTLAKVAAVLPGFAYALLPCLPRECSGFRCLIAEDYWPWIPVAGLAVGAASLWIVASLDLVRRLWSCMSESERLMIAASGLGLLSTIAPLVLYLPTYDKLWLQPLACWFLGTGMLLNVSLQWTDARLRSVRHLVAYSCLMIVTIAAANLVRATWNNRGPTPNFTEAQDVAMLVRPGDLLVGDWNEPFRLYQAVWAPRANSFNVPTEAERGAAGMLQRLKDAVARTQAAGGEVFFLGLLDLSRDEWKSLLGEKRGVPYDAFESFRHCADTIKSIKYHGRVITLRIWRMCARN